MWHKGQSRLFKNSLLYLITNQPLDTDWVIAGNVDDVVAGTTTFLSPLPPELDLYIEGDFDGNAMMNERNKA